MVIQIRYIGGKVSKEHAIECGFICDEDSGGHPTLEKNFDPGLPAWPLPDKMGFNGYSIVIHLKGDAIRGIERVGHCHMAGGEGADTNLKRFPKHIHKQYVRTMEELLKQE